MSRAAHRFQWNYPSLQTELNYICLTTSGSWITMGNEKKSSQWIYSSQLFNINHLAIKETQLMGNKNSREKKKLSSRFPPRELHIKDFFFAIFIHIIIMTKFLIQTRSGIFDQKSSLWRRKKCTYKQKWNYVSFFIFIWWIWKYFLLFFSF